MLGTYSSILLAGGDIDFARATTPTSAARSAAANSTLAEQLLLALRGSADTTLLLQPYHADALSAIGALDALNASGQVEILAPWVNPATGRATAISNDRLRKLEQDMMPVAVTTSRHQDYVVASSASFPQCAPGHVWDATKPLCAVGSNCATKCMHSTCGCASPCDNCACCPACGGVQSCAGPSGCCVVPTGPTLPPTPAPPTPAQVQFQINQIDAGDARSAAGWVVEVFNNDGVRKPINTAATLDPDHFTYDVVLTPRFLFKRVVRWYWDHDEPLTTRMVTTRRGDDGKAGKEVNITLGPGEGAYVHFEV